MKYYLELTLIDQAEFPAFYVWPKLYTQLHLAFVEHKSADELIPYGVSFPEYKTGQRKDGTSFFYLGSKLRIFAQSEQAFQDLNLQKWLDRLADYVHIKSVKAVPDAVQHATFERARSKATLAARAQHQAQRRGIALDEALQHFQGYKEQTLDLPYIPLKSESNGSAFNLFVRKTEKAEAVHGLFGTYGLSKTSTVPVW